jgi:hypothetical protein
MIMIVFVSGEHCQQMKYGADTLLVRNDFLGGRRS